jgi:Pyruvate/2-oxoacid:ferredoxin oxidoreductase delta subunit
MPAFAEEIREAEEEGISFIFLAGPAAFLGRDGKVEAVRFGKTRGTTERGQALVTQEGEDFTVSSDLVLLAAGSGSSLSSEKSDLSWERGRIWVGKNGQTVCPGVFAGGDLVPGLGSVVDALASGKRAAAAIHLSVTGDNDQVQLLGVELGPGPSFSLNSLVARPPHWDPSQVVHLGEIDYLGRSLRQATVLERMDPVARVAGFDEVVAGPTAKQAQMEAFRCFYCGTCIGCDDCHKSCPELALLPPSTGKIDDLCADDYCKGCGTCATTCPRGILTMGEREVVR